MNRTLIFLLTLAMAAPAWAELYRWVDEQGQVHYSDMPPPKNVKKLQRLRGGTPPDPEAGRVKVPVTLYSGGCGATCDQAAEFLTRRGVPFTLKTVDQDVAAAQELKRRTGDLGVPVLIVGEAMQRGFSPSVWDKMLEVGGYPPVTAKPPAAPPPQEPSQEPSQETPARGAGGANGG